MQTLPFLCSLPQLQRQAEWIHSLSAATPEGLLPLSLAVGPTLMLSFLDPVHLCSIDPSTQIQPIYQDHKISSINLYWQGKTEISIQGPTIMEAYQILRRKLPHKGFNDYFRPLRRLGKGAFATVYLVEHKHTHQLLAAKVFSKEGQKLEVKGTETLLNEIELLRDLSHPHLLRLEGLFHTDNLIYLVTEHLEGGTLEEAMRHKHTLSGFLMRQMLQDCLSALVYLQQQGVVHRDLKPSNILKRQSDQRWVIADFGLAARLQQPPLFITCGTPGYMAPELHTQHKLNPSSDLYSLGVVAFQLMLGKLPFRMENEGIFQKKLIWQGLEAGECQEMPREAIELLEGLLQKDPSKRITARSALQTPFFCSEEGRAKWDNFCSDKKEARMQKILKLANIN